MTLRKTSGRLCLFSGVFLAAFSLSGVPGAQAALVMSLDDGATVGAGATCFIPDGGGTCTDSSGTTGQIAFIGTIGGWSVVTSIGTSQPVLGPVPPEMNLTLASATSSGAGTLTIAITETYFTGGSLPGFLFEANGFLPSGGSTSFLLYVDEDNAAFGTGTLLSDSGNISVGGSFAFADSGGPFVLDDPFSMTIVMEITADGAASGFQNNITATLAPIPGAVWLFGSALLGLFAAGRRRFFGVGKAAAA